MRKFSKHALFIALATASVLPTYATVFEPCPTHEKSTQQVFPAIPSFDRMILVPGAAAQHTDLYVGPIHWQEYFTPYIPFLEQAKIPFTLYSVSATGDENVEARYTNLLATVKDAQKNHERILLYGHSMGGLVSRLLLRDHSVWDTIAAVVTISAPHQGTELIDALLKSDSIVPWVSILSRIVGFDIHEKDYLTELTHGYATQNYNDASDFNPGMPPIYSIVAADSITHLYEGIPAFGVGGQLIEHELNSLSQEELNQRTGIWGTASDGIVPAYSQVWGNCLGWFHATHAKSLGKVLLPSQIAEFGEFMTQLTALLKPNTLFQYEKAAPRPVSSSLSSSL